MKRRKVYALLASISVIILCSGMYIFLIRNSDNTHTITSYALGNGYSLKIWEGCRIGHDDWDICPLVFYEVSKEGLVVIPQTELVSNNNGYTFDIKDAFSENGDLICIYDAHLWRRILIIFDKTNGESYPYLRSSEAWTDRYYQLQLKNPNLPPAFTLEF